MCWTIAKFYGFYLSSELLKSEKRQSDVLNILNETDLIILIKFAQ